MKNKIRVIIAEDSPTVRQYLTSLIDETPGMKVIGKARDGEQAIELVEELKPDVISMDINMPRMDGLEATRRIMAHTPTPVVVVSGLLDTDVELSIMALEAGALAVVEKPPARHTPAFEEKRHHLIQTIRAMADVRVISRRHGLQIGSNTKSTVRPSTRPSRTIQPEIIAIGASTGGPSALFRLLKDLPQELTVPVIIVQHMPHEFIEGLARWLNRITHHPVRIAKHNEVLQSGVVHLSPGDAHCTVVRQRGELASYLAGEKGDYRYQPSVDVLFHSTAECCGAAAIGIILSGMGDDGANGLLAMRRQGAWTLAQDQNSSTVFGMPGAAINRGAVVEVLPIEVLSTAIIKRL